MNVEQEIFRAVIVGLIYIAIFGTASAAHILFPKSFEISRKTAHFLAGIAALSFPYIFQSHITIFILSFLFIIFITVTKLKKALNSIHGVKRISFGSYLYPVSIYITFLLAADNPPFYFISILVLAVSDAAAALIGERYGTIKFDMGGNVKTLEGTISFFLVSFLCVQIPMLVLTDINELSVIIVSITIALVVTGLELISLAGTDNIFIPLGTYYLLYKVSARSLEANVETIMQLLLAVILVAAIFGNIRYINFSGKIAILLLSFSSLAVAYYEWFLPVMLFNIGFAVLLRKYGKAMNIKAAYFDVRSVLYLGMPAVFLMFIAAIFDIYKELYLPFMMTLSSQSAIVAALMLNEIYSSDDEPDKEKTTLLRSFVVSAASVVGIALLPVILFQKTGQFFVMILLFSLSFAAFAVNYLISKIFHESYSNDMHLRLRISFVSTIICAIIVFLIQSISFPSADVLYRYSMKRSSPPAIVNVINMINLNQRGSDG